MALEYLFKEESLGERVRKRKIKQKQNKIPMNSSCPLRAALAYLLIGKIVKETETKAEREEEIQNKIPGKSE